MASPMALDDKNLSLALSRLKHDAKWDVLKSRIQSMYTTSPVKEIAKCMKERHGFDANIPAYKFHFKKWGWAKNDSFAVKEKAIQKIQDRSKEGRASQVTHKGRTVNVQKLRRHVKATDWSHSSRATMVEDVLISADNIFVNWNMPFGVQALNPIARPRSPSTQTMNYATPNSLQVFTPDSYRTPPSNHVSPGKFVGPRSSVIQRRSAVDRAKLFIGGQVDEAIQSMNDNEKLIASSWLYQFWHFSYVTAKYWGNGPRKWTASDLQFAEYEQIRFHSNPASPGLLNTSSAQNSSIIHQQISTPPRFCRYAIHVIDEVQIEGDTISAESDGHQGEAWPAENSPSSMGVRLADALKTNDFSSIATNDMPLAVDLLAHAAAKSPEKLLGESLTFAIMAGNVDQIRNVFDEAIEQDVNLLPTHYIHVAASYLNGGSTCCSVMRACLGEDGYPDRVGRNEHGHTVLDNLFLNIIKSHSKTPLESLDGSLRRQPRFIGAEIDLCGRWEADSHCYRSLLQAGRTEIPFSWKHKFCHTSVQAIWHCIKLLDRNLFDFDDPSGIFVRYCTIPTCGEKLELGPLHALTLATFHLGIDGSDDEDFFGMSAILMRLLSCSFESNTTAQISLPLLLGHDTGDQCTHHDTTPLQLAEMLSETLGTPWSQQKQFGWRVYCQILRVANEVRQRRDVDSEVEDGFDDFGERGSDIDDFIRCTDNCTDAGIIPGCFDGSSVLGHVWAAFQAEVLTHRKQTEDDPWVSERFDMGLLLRCLETGSSITLPILQDNLLQPYCRCGNFAQRKPYLYKRYPVRRQVMRVYFGNVDIWERSTFLE